ncbi:MAG: lipase family alpha/beta hydrolase [Nocardioides sp.]
MFPALSPARRRFLLLVVALAVATAAVVAAVVVRRATDTVDPVPQGTPGPVLLVPGYGGSLRALDPLRARLRDEGRDASVVPLAGDGTGDLEVQAQVLADAAQATLERTGAESVDVIGYSSGGVVARLWVRDFGGAEVARRVLTIGSPHHGTSVAELASGVVPGLCTGACEQLEPDSDLLRALNAGDETPDGPRFVSIWTTTDELVTPPDSSRLDGALNLTVQDMCPASRVSHLGLPSDPVVLDTVVIELGVASPAVPPSPDCSGS